MLIRNWKLEIGNLEYLLYLTIFLIPTYLIRFEFFGIPTNVLEVLVGITFLVWLKCKMQNAKFKMTNQNAKLLFTNYYLLITGIFLLLLGLAIGIFVSADVRTSLGVLKGWFLVPLAFFIMSRTVLVQDEQKEKALWSLALSGMGVAIIGLFYWVSGKLTFDGRLAAFYESPNMLAMYIAPAFLIFTMMQKLKSPWVTRYTLHVTRFTAVFLLFILLLTHSLGALMGIAGTLIFTACGYFWGKEKRNLWVPLYIGIVTVGVLLPFSSLFFNPWEMGRTSLASRLMIWQASAAMLKDNWFFGIGPGMFYETYLAYQKNFPPFLEWAVPHPHNIFLAAWLYGGVLGLLGFLTILCWFFHSRSGWTRISTRINADTINIVLVSIIMYLLIHGMIDNTLWRNDVAMAFWLIMALRR